MSESRFAGIDRLYGKGSAGRLHRAHVAVIGLGGVGSWAAEALARSGVGALTLIDADEVCVSNTNRQLHALDGQYGRAKAAVMTERIRAINPAIEAKAVERFLTPSALDELLDYGFDLVLDACDAFRVKVGMTAWCRRRDARHGDVRHGRREPGNRDAAESGYVNRLIPRAGTAFAHSQSWHSQFPLQKCRASRR